MDLSFTTETESEKDDSSLWLQNSKPLAEILTEMNQNVQRMLRLIKDGKTDSTEKLLCLYQSLGETYNDLNQELLKGLLNFDFKLSCSDHNASTLAVPMGEMSSFKSHVSPSLDLDLESGTSYSSLKHLKVSPSSEMLQSSKLNCEVEKNQSAFLLAELEAAVGELEARNVDIETEKRHVVDLESKLSDSGYKIENLESELDEIRECLSVSEAEVAKLWEMLNECKTDKANLQTGNAAAGDLLDSLRTELRSREIQIEQMEEYLNQVLCLKDTEVVSESETDKTVVEELRAKVELLEKQVELQRNLITEREEEKREVIRELCFSLDHYKSRYLELVRSLSDNNNNKSECS